MIEDMALVLGRNKVNVPIRCSQGLIGRSSIIFRDVKADHYYQ